MLRLGACSYPVCALMLQVYFDPKETNYSALLDCFFDHVDPTTLNQQGNDRGTQYRSGIYYHNEEQKAAAEKVSACVGCKAFVYHTSVISLH